MCIFHPKWYKGFAAHEQMCTVSYRRLYVGFGNVCHYHVQ